MLKHQVWLSCYTWKFLSEDCALVHKNVVDVFRPRDHKLPPHNDPIVENECVRVMFINQRLYIEVWAHCFRQRSHKGPTALLGYRKRPDSGWHDLLIMKSDYDRVFMEPSFSGRLCSQVRGATRTGIRRSPGMRTVEAQLTSAQIFIYCSQLVWACI